MTCNRKTRGAAAAIVAACSLFALSAPAAADTDIGAGNGDRIAATLTAADDVTTLRYDIPAGASLSIAAQGTKKRGTPAPVVTFRVLEPDGDEAAPFQPVKGSGAKLTNLVATVGGTWRVEVKAAGATFGDYKVSVRWKAPPKVPIAATLTPGTTTTFPFTADAGGSATFTVAPARGSVALPRLVDVRSADDSFVLPLPQPAPGAKSHRVANVALPAGGAFVLTIRNADTAPGTGAVAGSIAPKLPKLRPRSVTVTARQLGADDGAAAFGSVIGPGGGSIAIDDSIPAVAGASVVVPGGALTFPTAIVIGTSTDLPPRSGLGTSGPAVFFGPEGTRFGTPATITIPFDPSADPAQVRIFTRDAKGKVTEVLPASSYQFDLGTGTVSFPASHFSSYQAFSPPKLLARGDLDGDGIADVVLASARAGASFEGRIDVFRGSATLQSAPTSAADVTFTGLAPNDAFGKSIALADVNGDKIDDLCVARRGATRTVLVWFGGPGFLDGGAPDVTLTPGANDPNFGISLCGGDLNADGAGDLVVGDESNRRTGTTKGACFVFFGPITADRSADDADVILTGANEGDLFGAIVAAGDVTSGGGSGDDLVVGADQLDTAPIGTGAVFLFRGPLASGTRSATTATTTLTGETAGDGFGLPLALADVDGGGVLDIIVSATTFDAPGAVDAGKLYVYRGENDIGTAVGNTVFATLTGTSAMDVAGSGIFAANVTGLGDAEVLVGVPGRDSGSTDAGAVLVWNGTTTGTIDMAPAALLGVFGPASGRAIGGHFLAAADVNGDGFADVAIGDPADATGGALAGACFLFFGTSGTFPAGSTLSSADIVFTGEPLQQLGATEN